MVDDVKMLRSLSHTVIYILVVEPYCNLCLDVQPGLVWNDIVELFDL